MDPTKLIPVPDTIPAPAWFFYLLDVVTFLLHILVINVILGGSLLILFSRLRKPTESLNDSFTGAIVRKIPMGFALGVNLGIAPLLFIQVIYGQFIYSSSVLMAVFWILVIPLLILAYYGAYFHVRKYETSPTLSIVSIAITSLILLYIGFTYVNNMTLMVQPEKWGAYFNNSSGTILNVSDPTFIPRYLHFVIASIAIAGLFLALIWSFREKKKVAGAAKNIRTGLKIFAIATCIQVVIGLWFLIVLPRDLMLAFMGKNLFYTIILMLGILLGIGSIVMAFMGKLIPTIIHLVATMVVMVISRVNLRSLYLDDVFKLESLELNPQYGVMTLFLVIFVAGLVIVGYMIKLALAANERRGA
ncbi:hypothetical protein JW964_14870 [candidate division KSB1 bacterium]|nr:hypothetical protein [candidate division KSB1 bacterium]